jgi:hypothetical protein
MIVAICKVVRLNKVGVNCIVYGKEDADDEHWHAYCVFFETYGIQVGITLETLYLRWEEICLITLIVYSFPTAVS